MTITLYVGNKNYSVWSLRPWLVLRWAGIAFEGKADPARPEGLRQARDRRGAESIAERRVPCLHADGLVVWDSLSIAEWAAETYPGAELWPVDKAMRAEARSVTAEMHSGFSNVRNDLPMNIPARVKPQDWKAETRAELARIDQIWAALRTRHASLGPWLFGKGEGDDEAGNGSS